MIEKYILSICYLEFGTNEILSEPYGLFDTFELAEKFAISKIEKMEMEFSERYCSNEEINIDDYYSFDYTIKNICF